MVLIIVLKVMIDYLCGASNFLIPRRSIISGEKKDSIPNYLKKYAILNLPSVLMGAQFEAQLFLS